MPVITSITVKSGKLTSAAERLDAARSTRVAAQRARKIAANGAEKTI
jgi:hypothetical protein